jgi:hypothetical protein
MAANKTDAEALYVDGLYVLSGCQTSWKRPSPFALHATTEADALRCWHERLSHVNAKDVRKLARLGKLGDNIRFSDDAVLLLQLCSRQGPAVALAAIASKGFKAGRTSLR